VTTVNVALPAIQRDLHVSAQSLQWIPSGYLLSYGGFMLLGGRAADLAGRRRTLVAGTAVFAVSQLVAGLAPNSAVVIGARLAQGLGGALMLPAALSILTTTFGEGADRRKALGAWGAMIGLSSVGSLLGGLLVQGAGWRWVFLALPPLCLAVLAGVFWLIGPDQRRAELAHLDLPGAVLSTGGLLLLVYALVRAPVTGWGSAPTVAELAGAAALLLAFVVGERRSKNPLLPLSLFRVPGLGAADFTALIGFAGFIAVFYFYTLYSQNVLGYSPVKSGLGFLPVAAGIATVARAAPRLISRIGTRPVLIAGTLVAAGGVYWLSRMPVHGSYFTDLFPGLVISAAGIGALTAAVTIGANAGVPPDKAGLAAALLNAAQQVGGALGLAVFSAIATARTSHLLATRAAVPEALTAGFGRALLVVSIFVLAAAVTGARARPLSRGR
jgi:EmrB/QacA subfamily drug resistance transporter